MGLFLNAREIYKIKILKYTSGTIVI